MANQNPKALESFAGSAVLHGRYGKVLGTLTQSLCKVTLANSPIDIAADCVAPTKTGSAETFDLSSVVDTNREATLSITLNGVAKTYTCRFWGATSISAVTANEADAAIAAAPEYDASFVAVSSPSTAVVMTAGDGVLGTSASMVISGALATALGINGTTAGTGAPSAFQLLVTGFDGNPAVGVKVAVGIYDASTAGALLADTYLQVASKGAFVSGEGTNSAVGVTDANGEFDFEVVSDISGTDSLYVDMEALSTGFLTDNPASREQVDKTA